jgi:hypothetical protein
MSSRFCFLRQQSHLSAAIAFSALARLTFLHSCSFCVLRDRCGPGRGVGDRKDGRKVEMLGSRGQQEKSEGLSDVTLKMGSRGVVLCSCDA